MSSSSEELIFFAKKCCQRCLANRKAQAPVHIRRVLALFLIQIEIQLEAQEDDNACHQGSDTYDNG